MRPTINTELHAQFWEMLIQQFISTSFCLYFFELLCVCVVYCVFVCVCADKRRENCIAQREASLRAESALKLLFLFGI